MLEIYKKRQKIVNALRGKVTRRENCTVYMFLSLTQNINLFTVPTIVQWNSNIISIYVQ